MVKYSKMKLATYMGSFAIPVAAAAGLALGAGTLITWGASKIKDRYFNEPKRR